MREERCDGLTLLPQLCKINAFIFIRLRTDIDLPNVPVYIIKSIDRFKLRIQKKMSRRFEKEYVHSG